MAGPGLKPFRNFSAGGVAILVGSGADALVGPHRLAKADGGVGATSPCLHDQSAKTMATHPVPERRAPGIDKGASPQR
jgi:hypothetical protein